MLKDKKKGYILKDDQGLNADNGHELWKRGQG